MPPIRISRIEPALPCDVLCVPCPAFVKRSVEDDIEEPGSVITTLTTNRMTTKYFDEGYDEGYDEDFDDEEDEADYEVHKDDDGCCDQD